MIIAINRWAFRHQPLAVGIIAILSTVLLVLSIMLAGFLQQRFGMAAPLLPFVSLVVLGAVYATLLGLYGSQIKQRSFFFSRFRFVRLKLMVLAKTGLALSLITWFFAANLHLTLHVYQPALGSLALPANAHTPSGTSSFTASMVEPAKEIEQAKPATNFKELKAQWKELKREWKKQDTPNYNLAIFLTIFIGVVAALGIAVLACYLACSGQEALGIITAVLGLGVIIFFMVKLVRKYTRLKKGLAPASNSTGDKATQ